MGTVSETYVAFWKSKKERMKDVNRIFEATGMLVYRLMGNYFPNDLLFTPEQNN